MRVIDIYDGTCVDGPGLRTTVYFAGCTHQCHDCHNKQSWPADSGTEISRDEIMGHVIENDFDVTFSGGDPLFQIEELVKLAQQIKSIGKNIWCYTGYTYEQVLESDRLRPILGHIDVLVDGRFRSELKDLTLRFRGSSNQRLIDVVESMRKGSVVMFEE